MGIIANSIAIISDAINNLTDALSSIVTIIGTKLAGKAPDKKHPFGYGRMEYMTSLIVSEIVLYAGIKALIESIKKIIYPENVEYSLATLIVIILGIVVKIFLSMFLQRKGKKVNSGSLVASGIESFNDVIISTSVLAATIIYMIFHINLEAYVGVLVSTVILKNGINLIRESVDNMLETRVESSLSKKIKKEVLKEDEVQGAFDLVLNNYGPDKYLGSVHIEVPDTLTVSQVDKISRKISKNVRNKYGVVLHTIGVYSINTQDEKIISIQKDIHDIVFSHEGIIQMHGFYYDEEEQTISLDIIIDFSVKDREKLFNHIYDEIQEKYKDYKIIIILDVDGSD